LVVAAAVVVGDAQNRVAFDERMVLCLAGDSAVAVVVVE